MTTKQYNTEDFANAEFARHPSGVIAARLDDGDSMPWLMDDETWLSDEGMACNGWVPVREATAQPITLDTFQDAWESAEDADGCNPGDILIHWDPSSRFGRVEVWKSGRSGPMGSHTRTLHRAPTRPEGTEALEALLDEWGNLTRPKPLLADWLAERGVRVTEEGEK